jgi:hypothetical protein
MGHGSWGAVTRPEPEKEARKERLRRRYSGDGLFPDGQVEKALKTQERAMAMAKDTLLETARSAKDRLEQCKKAAKK